MTVWKISKTLSRATHVEVTKTVTGELAEDGDHENLGHAPATAAGKEERAVVPPDLVDRVGDNGLAHLLELEEDERSVGVAVAVVLGEEGVGTLVVTLGHEVTRRLGDEEDEDEDEHTSDGLEDKGKAPLDVRVDVRGTKGDGSGGNRATEPTTVVETSAATTPLRRSDLHRVGRGSDSHDGDTETKDKATDHELGNVVTSAGEDHAEDNDPRTSEHGLATGRRVSVGPGWTFSFLLVTHRPYLSERTAATGAPSIEPTV